MIRFKIKKIKFFFVIVCVLQLIYIFHLRSGFNSEIIKNSFSKNSVAIYAVSPEIIESNILIKKYEIVNFYLSNFLIKDTYFYQRSIEYNYPTRIDDKSEFVFFKIEEETPSACKILESGKYLKLIRC